MGPTISSALSSPPSGGWPISRRTRSIPTQPSSAGPHAALAGLGWKSALRKRVRSNTFRVFCLGFRRASVAAPCYTPMRVVPAFLLLEQAMSVDAVEDGPFIGLGRDVTAHGNRSGAIMLTPRFTSSVSCPSRKDCAWSGPDCG
jgi:hypothetical protein